MGAEGLSSRAIIGLFYERLAQYQGMPELLALSGEPFKSDQESETYPWIGQSPQLREWIGGRQAKSFNDQSITLVNKHFESTIQIPLAWKRRDKTGQILQRINELAERSAAHWWKLVCEKLVTGETATCYDGQAYWDTDHSENDSGTQDNDIGYDISDGPASLQGTTTSPSAEDMIGAILKGIGQMLAFKDDRGEFCNELAREFLVLVPTTFWRATMTALGQVNVGAGATNPLTAVQSVVDGFSIRALATPRFNATWTTKFPIFCTSGTQKPMIRQEESPLTMKVLDATSEHAFHNDEELYGVDGWRNVTFGDWKKTCLVTFSA